MLASFIRTNYQRKSTERNWYLFLCSVSIHSQWILGSLSLWWQGASWSSEVWKSNTIYLREAGWRKRKERLASDIRSKVHQWFLLSLGHDLQLSYNALICGPRFYPVPLGIYSPFKIFVMFSVACLLVFGVWYLKTLLPLESEGLYFKGNNCFSSGSIRSLSLAHPSLIGKLVNCCQDSTSPLSSDTFTFSNISL